MIIEPTPGWWRTWHRSPAKNLEDRQAWLLTKSLARGVLKHQLAKTLGENHGALGLILGTLFSFLSERADCRSWTTLPDSWQARRLFVPPGTHRLTLQTLVDGHPIGDPLRLGRYELEPGETMLLFARTLDRRIHVHPVRGLPITECPENQP